MPDDPHYRAVLDVLRFPLAGALTHADIQLLDRKSVV